MEGNVRRIPVFVFPTSLQFYLLTRTSHKQLLTLYNPYDFAVRFQVLCTAPGKYTVIDPDGSIAPRSCVDIVIRHGLPVSANCNITDKFRINMIDHVTKQLLGRRDVEATLHSGECDTSSNDGDNFQSLPTSGANTDGQRNAQYPIPASLQRSLPSNSNNIIIISLGLLCILLLLLPTAEFPPERTKIPSYLHPTISMKLVAAYVLGLVSVVLLRL